MTSTSKTDIIVAFDFYGTLVDTSSVIDQLSEEFGSNAAEISSRWRRYQLEYTWRLNSMNRSESFSAVTKQSLIHTLKELDVPIRDTSVDSYMSCYDNLTPFPAVDPLLADLGKTPNLIPVLFSNADMDMLNRTINRTIWNHQLDEFGVFQRLLSVDATLYFKPHPDTYHHIAESMGRKKSIESMREIWLVSANPFDIVGATNVGMETVWVDRDRRGWKDQLILGKWGTPSVVVNELDEVVHAIQKYVGIVQE